eukprot:CAMPEP_0183303338 /NCGR_PEP_ID=MMETSP0160_2-20130417/8817_1 /TAXON_ID=2839 ORGANISM="Odontella Sinensis, Strain Grunow 1884" /NCGR_SAMPLE_ID=MMETSP0160_2 /ASSEMBLY_ACC=CAM_ASM_000250 /LENGTH=411 /DNA_ID=CAMNT_0025466231 /DNA_START=42 /DNA_END=1277 /DNA_ORIENTATION=+
MPSKKLPNEMRRGGDYRKLYVDNQDVMRTNPASRHIKVPLIKTTLDVVSPDGPETGLPPSTEGQTGESGTIINSSPESLGTGQALGCEMDIDGSFGQTNDINREVVAYRYEIETIAKVSTMPEMRQLLQDEILPDLEKEINENLMALMFPDGCRRRLAIGDGARRLSLAGLSPKPDDGVDLTDAGMCQFHDVNSDNFCSVVNGGLTIFGSNDLESTKEEVLSAIRNGMSRTGSLVNANDAIEKLTFIETVTANAFSNPDDNRAEVTAESRTLGTALFVSMGSVAALVIAVLVLYRRRKTDEDDESDADTNDFQADHADVTKEEIAMGVHRHPMDFSAIGSESDMDSSTYSYSGAYPRSTVWTDAETVMDSEVGQQDLMPASESARGKGHIPSRLLGDTSRFSEDDSEFLFD